MGKKSYLCNTDKGKQDSTQRAASPQHCTTKAFTRVARVWRNGKQHDKQQIKRSYIRSRV